MSAERTPASDASRAARLLGGFTRLAARRPWYTLALAGMVTLAALVFTGLRLEYRTSRLDLLNPASDYNRRWIEYLREFDAQDDVVVVVEGADRGAVVAVIDALSAELVREDRLFRDVLARIDLDALRSKALFHASAEELAGLERFVDQAAPIVQGDWRRLSLTAQLEGLASGPSLPGATTSHADRLLASLGSVLDEQATYRSPWPEAPESLSTAAELDAQYLLANEGRLGFILLRLVRHDDGFAQGSEGIDVLRELIAQTAPKFPRTSIGLTGLPVMENDEMRASQAGMLQASVLSLVGVACLFMAMVGGLRHPTWTVLALLIGMAWSFGYLTLAVGHLNILSVSFAVILIGLGIDFGIHYVLRYLELRPDADDCGAALENTARGVGPGVVTGAFTTAIAFFTAGFAEFTGVAELGVIAGGGILLCCLAALVLLPALLRLDDERRRASPPPRPLTIGAWTAPLMRWPRATLAVTSLAVLAASVGMLRLRYDHNLLNLQPAGLESVELEKKLLAETDRSVWFAISICASREEVLARKARFLEKPSVERCEEIVSLLPDDAERKAPVIARIGAQIETLPDDPPEIPVAPPDVLLEALSRVERAWQAAQSPRLALRAAHLRANLARLPAGEVYARTAMWQQRTARELIERLGALHSIADARPPAPSDVPESLRRRFHGERGWHLLKVYARGDIWDMDALGTFVRDMRSVDPHATGQPLQTFEASAQMQGSYEQAALYALAAIWVVLACTFRRAGEVLLALAPAAVGMSALFGLMGLLDIALNPANMIVLPLILGIGIDDGVHIVHDFRSQRGAYRLSNSTATGVLLTSLTTMVGFGSLMIANHQGLASLGRVMTIGMACCLLSSLVMLPALLTCLARAQGRGQEDEPRDDEPASPVRPLRRLRPSEAERAGVSD